MAMRRRKSPQPLDVYKWEKAAPEYQQVISHPAFAQWIDDQPSVYRSVIHSANLE